MGNKNTKQSSTVQPTPSKSIKQIPSAAGRSDNANTSNGTMAKPEQVVSIAQPSISQTKNKAMQHAFALNNIVAAGKEKEKEDLKWKQTSINNTASIIKQKVGKIEKEAQHQYEWHTQYGHAQIKINKTAYGWIMFGIIPSDCKSNLGCLELDISKCIAYNGGSGNAWAFGAIASTKGAFFQHNSTITMAYHSQSGSLEWQNNDGQLACIEMKQVKLKFEKYSHWVPFFSVFNGDVVEWSQ